MEKEEEGLKKMKKRECELHFWIGWSSLYIGRGSKNPLPLHNYYRGTFHWLAIGNRATAERLGKTAEMKDVNLPRTCDHNPGCREGNERDNLGKFQSLLHFWDLLQRNRKTRVFHAQSDFRFTHSVFRFDFAILGYVLQQSPTYCKR